MRFFQHVPLTVAVTALAMGLAGCGSHAADSGATQNGSNSNTGHSHTSASGGGSDSTSEPKSGDSHSSASENTLRLTINGGVQDFTPARVICQGSDSIRRVVAKSENGLPLLEVVPGQFGLLKVTQGKPEKTQNPSGVSVTADSVSFTNTSIGSAKVEGTLTCTQREN